MSPRKAWIVYTALRILFFAVPFAALMLIGWEGWLAAITATLVAVSLSMILLSKPRETAAETIYDWRNRDRTADDIVEDEAIEKYAGPVSDEGSSLASNGVGAEASHGVTGNVPHSEADAGADAPPPPVADEHQPPAT